MQRQGPNMSKAPLGNKAPPGRENFGSVKFVGSRGCRWLTLPDFISWMLHIGLAAVLAIGLVVEVAIILIFALLFWSAGSDCFAIGSGEFDFPEMIWLSVHTITSIGYGSSYPTCSGGQILVFLEYYAGLLITSIIMALIVQQALVPRPRVRFANKVLLTDRDVSGNKGVFLSVRMARESRWELRDCHCSLQAAVTIKGDDEQIHGVQYENLELHGSDTLIKMDQWVLFHRIDDPSSPLHDLHKVFVRGEHSHKDNFLRGLVINLVAFDTNYQQEIRLYHSYDVSQVVLNATWEDMIVYRSNGKGKIHPTVDLDKLDQYTMTQLQSAEKPYPSLSEDTQL